MTANSRRICHPLRWVLTLTCAAAAVVIPPAAASAQTDQLVQWTTEAGGNGHWYRYLNSGNIFQGFTFQAARTAAEASTYNGLQGYLATVTSADEQSFLNGAFTYLLGFGNVGTAWLGASDAEEEGDWRWLGGPESGQLMSYTNWLPGHPFNAPGAEDFDQMVLYIQAGGPTTYGWSTVGSTGGALGYIIEYGNGPVTVVPEPGPLGLLAAGLAALGWMMRRRRAMALRT
jgi:hypothetical protein